MDPNSLMAKCPERGCSVSVKKLARHRVSRCSEREGRSSHALPLELMSRITQKLQLWPRCRQLEIKPQRGRRVVLGLTPWVSSMAVLFILTLIGGLPRWRVRRAKLQDKEFEMGR